MLLLFYRGGGGGTPAVIPPAPESPAGKRRGRERYLVKYEGKQILVDSLDELQSLIDSLRAQQPKKRNKTRPVAKIEIPADVQADLPDLTPLLKKFDFEGLRAAMEKLEAIQRDLDDEEDIEMLVLH